MGLLDTASYQFYADIENNTFHQKQNRKTQVVVHKNLQSVSSMLANKPKPLQPLATAEKKKENVLSESKLRDKVVS